MAIIKGKNPRKPYTVRYRDAAGKQREASFTTRKEADAFDNDQKRAKRYGNDVDLKAGKGLFNDAAEAYIKRLPLRNHVCTVVNLTSELVAVCDGAVAERWPVIARR